MGIPVLSPPCRLRWPCHLYSSTANMPKASKRVQKEYKKLADPNKNCKKKELGKYLEQLDRCEIKKSSKAIVVSFKTAAGPFVGLPVIVEITLPSEYPFKAPDAKFLSPMFHPNVSNEGQVCKDVLSGDWGPAKQIIDTVGAIENLLIAPSTDGGPLNPTAAEFFKTNGEAAIKKKQEAFRTANTAKVATAASAFASATPFPAFVASMS